MVILQIETDHMRDYKVSKSRICEGKRFQLL